MNIILTKKEKEIIQSISDFNEQLGFPELYIVGGFVRDRLLNKKSKDIDLTVNSNSKSFVLGVLYAASNNLNYKMRTGEHISVFEGDLHVDFSTGRIYHDFVDTQSSLLKKETLSRDFTINSLLYNPFTKKIVDISGNGINDVENRIIRTCLDPEITFKNDPKRIFRALLYATKLGFKFDKKIIDFLKSNISFVHRAFLDHQKYFGSMISESLNYDENKTIDFLKATESFHLVPLLGNFKNILIKRKLLNEYFIKNDQESQTNDALDLGSPINAINQFVPGHPSSVPNSFRGDGYKDDNNVDMYRSLPYLT